MKAILVVGAARTGTTLLGNLLAAVDGVSSLSHPLHWGQKESALGAMMLSYPALDSDTQYARFVEQLLASDLCAIAGTTRDVLYGERLADVASVYLRIMEDRCRRDGSAAWLSKLDPLLLTFPDLLARFRRALAARGHDVVWVTVDRRTQETVDSYLNMEGENSKWQMGRVASRTGIAIHLCRLAQVRHFARTLAGGAAGTHVHVQYRDMVEDGSAAIAPVLAAAGLPAAAGVASALPRNRSPARSAVPLAGYERRLVAIADRVFSSPRARRPVDALVRLRERGRRRYEPFSYRLLLAERFPERLMAQLERTGQTELAKLVAAHGGRSRAGVADTPDPAPTAGGRSRVLLVSRSAPPGVSGSAHVLKALLEADVAQRLVAVGERSWSGRQRGEPPARLRLLDSEVRLFGRGARFLAPLRRLLRGGVARRLGTMVAAEDVKRVVCVFPDAFYCAAALDAVAGTGKPIDFWFHNTYADNRSGIPGWLARRLERRIVDAAERLFFINDALCARFAEKYPEAAGKCRVLRHPVPGVGESAAASRGFAGKPVQALLMGNLNESNLDAACRMMRALTPCAGLNIRVCTPVPRPLLAARGMPLAGAEFLGYVDDAAMDRLLSDADLFLLPHGLSGGYSAEEYRTIFPTRAAHYLARGRPILAHCPEGSGLQRYLAQTGSARIVTEASESAIAAAFEDLRADPPGQEALAARALAAAADFAPNGILAALLAEEGH